MGDINFKPEQRKAANRGSRAAVIAGLPATEMDAVRQAGVQNFQDRTVALRGQVQQQQMGNQMAGLANLLRLVALMRAMNPGQPQIPASPRQEGMFLNAMHQPNYGYGGQGGFGPGTGIG